MTEFWVLGGYGEVGKAAVKMLYQHRQPDDKIFVAGRNGEKAAAFAASFGSVVRGVKMDFSAPPIELNFTHDSVIINCVEAISDDWLSLLSSQPITFIDVSATKQYLDRLRRSFSESATAKCVTEVGVSPGLTNLLAEALYAKTPDVQNIEIFLEMGMGKHHGYAATKWFVDALFAPYQVIENGKELNVYPRKHRTGIEFEMPARRRISGIGVGFSDQIEIARRLSTRSARTYVGVAPAWFNNVLNGMMSVKLLAKYSQQIAGFMGKVPAVGPVRTSIKVVGTNENGKALSSLEVLGPDQSLLTGQIAAFAALRAAKLSGVGAFTLPEMMRFEDMLNSMSQLKILARDY